MALSETLTHEIFTRLRVRYGAKLAAAYQGIDLADVARDWAEVLDGAGAHTISYALVNLPLDWPPTAGQFLDLCRHAPEKKLLALDRPEPTPEERARVASMLAALRKKILMSKSA